VRGQPPLGLGEVARKAQGAILLPRLRRATVGNSKPLQHLRKTTHLTPPTETTMTDPEVTFTKPKTGDSTPVVVHGLADIQIRVFFDGKEVHGQDAIKVFCAVIAAQLETLWNSASQSRAVQSSVPPSPNSMNPNVGATDEPTV
jgi:hypothetical protein